eukprot:scaffold81933_cov64-Phaeocystis_antarctica.AAC.3
MQPRAPEFGCKVSSGRPGILRIPYGIPRPQFPRMPTCPPCPTATGGPRGTQDAKTRALGAVECLAFCSVSCLQIASTAARRSSAPRQQALSHVASQHDAISPRYMSVFRQTATAISVSRPRPLQMKETAPWQTEGPTRKTPGVFVDSSFAVKRGAPARQPFPSSDSPARSNRWRAAAATLPSNPVHRRGG